MKKPKWNDDDKSLCI